jgi:ATP-dependent helicase/nuclease subunit A
MVIVRSEKSLTGEWLDTVSAPWLLPDPDAKSLTLPDGRSIDVEYARLEHLPGPSKAKCNREPLYWFSESATADTRLPRVFNPSQAAAPGCRVIEQESIGQRIAIGPVADMTVLGTVLHACIAASFTDRASPLSEEEVQGLLLGADQGGIVAPEDVLRQIHAFQGWLAKRWPAAAAYAEYPLQMMLPSGQVLDGRIDLLLDVGDGWVLIDHKSAPQGAAHWETMARAHAGQLAAYSDALEHVSGRPVVGCWLYLPVAAGAVRLELGSV